MDFNLTSSGTAETVAFVALAAATLGIVIHIIFAVGVYRHAEFRNLLFAGPLTWAFATLLVGPFMAVAYWLIHVSALAVDEERGKREHDAAQQVSVAAFECQSCNHVASVVTADGCCVHCGVPVKPA